jgi:stage II sporulation protein E
MDRVATEVFRLRPFEEKKKKLAVQALKSEGIRVMDLYYIERPGERPSIGAALSLRDRREVSAAQVAGMLSVLFDCRLEASVACPYRLEREVRSFVFVEEASYVVLSGTARAVKEGEQCSGDHFTVMESENGRVTALLSDGMGSGEKASADSEMILELLEKFLEAGYPLTEALKLVNGALVTASDLQNMSTLDICDVDLYSGECSFYKMGAAASFIKRPHEVEVIRREGLPLGILQENTAEAIHRRLMDGDYCILMTDGVLDALKENHYEETMQQILSGISEQNPKEIAGRILQMVLHCSGGRIRDDMTIVVLGIWENV